MVQAAAIASASSGTPWSSKTGRRFRRSTALSTRGGQRLAGVKRHPTIEDNVTIYSNASVLGGETVIGEGSVIAGSTFVTFSVPPHSRVSVKEQEIRVRQPGERD